MGPNTSDQWCYLEGSDTRLDVMVDSSARNIGLGRTLMDAIISHPELTHMKHFELYCRPELIPFYERCGFKEVDRDARFMRRP